MNSLIAIRTCLQTLGPLSAADIAAHMGSTRDAVEPLIERWIAKGQVRRTIGSLPCHTRHGGCGSCTVVEHYEWVGHGIHQPP